MFSKCHFFVLKIQRNIFSIIFLFFALSLLIFSKSNIPAIRKGLSLWANSVVPTLFPFFVATELLMNTNCIYILGKFFNIIMKPLFNIRGEGSFAFIMGLISGYPVGAKIACNFRKNNICSKEECERLLSFTNNSGPLFIVGTIGISFYKNSTIGILLLITHILASISVGIIFRNWKSDYIYNSKFFKFKKNHYINKDNFNLANNNYSSKIEYTKQNKNFNNVGLKNLGEVMSKSISSSVNTIFMIGGFIVIFSAIISILNSSGITSKLITILFPLFNLFNIDIDFIYGILTGLLEITNGIYSISNVTTKKISINIILTALLLGFGGLSVLLQVWSITAKSDLSIKPYIYGKLLQGLIAAFYTYLAITFIPILNLNL